MKIYDVFGLYKKGFSISEACKILNINYGTTMNSIRKYFMKEYLQLKKDYHNVYYIGSFQKKIRDLRRDNDLLLVTR